jgi:predicted nucleic acid-binding protein
MATPLPVLIDLNIILDVVGSREPFKVASRGVLVAAELGAIEGFISAHTVTTFHYLVSKYLSPAIAHIRLIDLLQFLNIAAVDTRVIESSLALPYKDFEDAVQMMAAVQAGCSYVVTRDPEGFRMGPLPIISPGELLALIKFRN